MQISELAGWVDGLDEPSAAPMLAALKRNLDRSTETAWDTSRLTGRTVTLGRRGPADQVISQLGLALTDVTYGFDGADGGLHPPRHPAENELLCKLRDRAPRCSWWKHKRR